MKRQKILLVSLLAIALLAALNKLGITFYFYWLYWWYDVVMHFFGGVVVGLGANWLFFGIKNAKHKMLLVLLCVLVVGVGWEVFEYLYKISDSQEGYVKDTLNDLILDTAGALLVTALLAKKPNV